MKDNYDRLHFPADNPCRSAIYTRYITENIILRTHTSSIIPDLLKGIADSRVEDSLVLCPGICYRRDVVDRHHVGEPHQMDIWRTKKGEPRLDRRALIQLVETILGAMVPRAVYRTNDVSHPYTINGLEVEVMVRGSWLEILECGETHPRLLYDSGLNPKEYSGLALGLGLDRMVMIVKGIDDIRVLRSEDPRIKRQMADLTKYKSVSKNPSIQRDLSVSIEETATEEDICETIRDAMGNSINTLEEVKIVSETHYRQLPPQAIERLGIKPDQKNMLIRIILRSHERSLTHEEANEIRDRVHRAVDQSDTGGYVTYSK